MAGDNATQFSVESVEADGVVRISARGELDVATAQRLEEAVLEAIAASKGVTLDLSEVGFLDSTGLRAVISGLRDARAASLSFTLEGRSPAVERLLRITGLDHEF